MASIYQETIRSIFPSLQEERSDHLLCLGGEDATACREAPVFDSYPDSDEEVETISNDHLNLMVTSTPLG